MTGQSIRLTKQAGVPVRALVENRNPRQKSVEWIRLRAGSRWDEKEHCSVTDIQLPWAYNPLKPGIMATKLIPDSQILLLLSLVILISLGPDLLRSFRGLCSRHKALWNLTLKTSGEGMH